MLRLNSDGPMTPDLWWSLGLGGGIGLIYSLASHVVGRRAVRYSDHRFLKLFLGGMMVRMAVALVLLTCILVLFPVRVAAFTGSFLVVFFTGLVLEVLRLHRTQQAGRL